MYCALLQESQRYQQSKVKGGIKYDVLHVTGSFHSTLLQNLLLTSIGKQMTTKQTNTTLQSVVLANGSHKSAVQQGEVSKLIRTDIQQKCLAKQRIQIGM